VLIVGFSIQDKEAHAKIAKDAENAKRLLLAIFALLAFFA
jgi:hypothetical protein